MAKLIAIFLGGGVLALALYHILSGHPFSVFPPNDHISRIITSTNFWQITAIVAAILIATITINHSIKQANFQRDVTRLDRIRAEVGYLKALKLELENNNDIFNNNIKPNISQYSSGQSFHHAAYSVLAIAPNIHNNTLEYNTSLAKRIARFYQFLNEANLVFEQARNLGLSQQSRQILYSQVFSQHAANEKEWQSLINDLGEYTNYYEPLADHISKLAITRGTKVIGYIISGSNQMTILNIGGEGAQNISIKLDVEQHPNDMKKYLLAYLAPRHPATYSLDPPSNPNLSSEGKVVIKYESEHSGGANHHEFLVKWDADKSQWVFVSSKDSGKVGWESVPLGKIGGTYEYISQDRQQGEVQYDLHKSGKQLILTNSGNTLIEWLNVINESGDLDGWYDVKLQYVLEPNETIAVALPDQSENDKSFAGKIVYKVENHDKIYYKIFSHRWDSVSNKWVR